MPPESLILPTAWAKQRSLALLCARDAGFARAMVRTFNEPWRLGGASKHDAQRTFVQALRACNEIILSACAEKGSDETSLRATPCQKVSQNTQ